MFHTMKSLVKSTPVIGGGIGACLGLAIMVVVPGVFVPYVFVMAMVVVVGGVVLTYKPAILDSVRSTSDWLLFRKQQTDQAKMDKVRQIQHILIELQKQFADFAAKETPIVLKPLEAELMALTKSLTQLGLPTAFSDVRLEQLEFYQQWLEYLGEQFYTFTTTYHGGMWRAQKALEEFDALVASQAQNASLLHDQEFWKVIGVSVQLKYFFNEKCMHPYQLLLPIYACQECLRDVIKKHG